MTSDPSAARPYHHGDLGPALLRAAGDILEREGLPALTLRAIARAAGVSHMAPTHHFGDLSGLLSELAALGYRQFAEALTRAQDHPGARGLARATAQAYVAFARAHPGLFLLMFRSERLDFARPSLAEAAQAAALALRRSAGVADAEPDGDGRAGVALMVFNWSLVHGFAMLLLDGRLDGVLAGQGADCDSEALLDGALNAAFGPEQSPGPAPTASGPRAAGSSGSPPRCRRS